MLFDFEDDLLRVSWCGHGQSTFWLDDGRSMDKIIQCPDIYDDHEQRERAQALLNHWTKPDINLEGIIHSVCGPVIGLWTLKFNCPFGSYSVQKRERNWKAIHSFIRSFVQAAKGNQSPSARARSKTIVFLSPGNVVLSTPHLTRKQTDIVLVAAAVMSMINRESDWRTRQHSSCSQAEAESVHCWVRLIQARWKFTEFFERFFLSIKDAGFPLLRFEERLAYMGENSLNGPEASCFQLSSTLPLLCPGGFPFKFFVTLPLYPSS